MTYFGYEVITFMCDLNQVIGANLKERFVFIHLNLINYNSKKRKVISNFNYFICN